MAYVAFLDANVLLPQVLCDLLLRLAQQDLFRPAWSSDVLDEVIDNLRRIRPDLGEERLAKRRHAMENFFPHAMVAGYESLIDVMEVPKHDRHVAAAAVLGRADVLVTANIRDFPQDKLDQFGIKVESPDDFLIDQLTLRPEAVLREVVEQAASRRKPPVTLEEHLASLAKHVPRFAELLRERLLE